MAQHAIGRVETVSGEVRVTRTDGTQDLLSQGSEVFQGDAVETGPGASIAIIFVDETTFALDENASMVLDELIFDPQSQAGSAALSVLQGAFTFVTGKIAEIDPEQMTVTTPVGSIGIRGTHVAGFIAIDGSASVITVIEGAIVIVNQGGAVILDVPNQSTRIVSFATAPGEPFVMTPQELQQFFGRVFQTLPEQFGELVPPPAGPGTGGTFRAGPEPDSDLTGQSLTIDTLGRVDLVHGGVEVVTFAQLGGLILVIEIEESVLIGESPLSEALIETTIILVTTPAISGVVFVGGAGDDVFFGGAGNDRFRGGGGNDFFDGGPGIDTAEFSGNFANYTITFGSVIVTDDVGDEGTDTLVNVEFLQFADQTLRVDVPTVGETATLTVDEADIGGTGGGPVGTLTVGYYDMDLGDGSPDQVAPIETAGHTAVEIFDLSATELAGIDILFVQNPSNSVYGTEFLDNLTNIFDAVAAGMTLIIQDRFVTDATSILPDSTGFEIFRDFTDDADIDVLDPTSSLVDGPGGLIDNTTLDGGNSSSHGFALSGTLPAGADLVLSTSDATQVVLVTASPSPAHCPRARTWSSVPVTPPTSSPFPTTLAPARWSIRRSRSISTLAAGRTSTPSTGRT